VILLFSIYSLNRHKTKKRYCLIHSASEPYYEEQVIKMPLVEEGKKIIIDIQDNKLQGKYFVNLKPSEKDWLFFKKK